MFPAMRAGGHRARRDSSLERMGIDSSVVQNQSEEDMASATQNFDAVVIGAGFSGMYMLKTLRDKLGLNVRVYEAGDTVGGTWYWNRYPGARCDSDSYIYVFTFDKQMLQEWTWSERYPEQPRATI
jgi:cation diffusion facilitator CzcD-associated flavoprotein CzcO